MKIYLIRHAHASPSAGQPDAHRFLSSDGRTTARGVGRRLHQEGVAFDAVFTSPLVRAVQTAELICESLHYTGLIETMATLSPGCAPQPAAKQLVSSSSAVAAVGHEPTISDLGAFLVGRPGFPPFRPGQVCLIEDGVSSWKLQPHTLEIEVLNT